jgi:hypothetical protein
VEKKALDFQSTNDQIQISEFVIKMPFEFLSLLQRRNLKNSLSAGPRL